MSDYFNKYIGSYISSIGRIFTKSTAASKPKAGEAAITQVIQKAENLGFSHLPKQSRLFLRIAGLSGMTAIILSAYGAHVFKRKQSNSDLKELYYTAQYYHLVHSVALLGLPFVRMPLVVSGIFRIQTRLVFSILKMKFHS
jgi:hypothetical protein